MYHVVEELREDVKTIKCELRRTKSSQEGKFLPNL